jgi:hypothetical protein
MLKELIAAQLVSQLADVQSVLREIVTRGETQTARAGKIVERGELKAIDRAVDRAVDRPVDRRLLDVFDRGAKTDATRTPATPATPPTSTSSTPPPSSGQVQRALQNLQQQAGLPVTGRFDDATAQLLRNLGVVPSKPATTGAATTTTTTAPADPKDAKKPVDPTQQAAVRQRSTSVEQQVKTRLQQQLPARGVDDGRASSRAAAADNKPLDRALDPARLLASLFAAGFSGSGAEQTLASFQAAQKLPPTGQLDPRTVDALVSAGHLPAAAADAHHDAPTSKTSTTAPSNATSMSAAGAASDKARVDSNRAQAATTASDAHAADVVLRAQASSPEEARERARIESLLAQAAAKERGVQENKGDPTAVAGHGQNAGASTGLTGKGGEHGGVGDVGDEGALSVDDGTRGDESSNANADSGDDDHDDDDRGEAVAALGDEDLDDEVDADAALPDGHYRVPRLGEQVQAALDVVFRIDDGTVPVHYTWDVSLYRPGVYVDGQAAEVVWRLVVDRAHAFDPVWQRAVDAIGARLLYLDPDADPLVLDDVLAALRRARVR